MLMILFSQAIFQVMQGDFSLINTPESPAIPNSIACHMRFSSIPVQRQIAVRSQQQCEPKLVPKSGTNPFLTAGKKVGP